MIRSTPALALLSICALPAAAGASERTIGVALEGATDLNGSTGCPPEGTLLFAPPPGSPSATAANTTPITCPEGISGFRPHGLVRVVFRQPLAPGVTLRVDGVGGVLTHTGRIEWTANEFDDLAFPNPSNPTASGPRVHSAGQTAWIIGGGLSVGAEARLVDADIAPYVSSGLSVFAGRQGQSIGPRKNERDGDFAYTQNLRVRCLNAGSQGIGGERCSGLNEAPLTTVGLGGYLGVGARAQRGLPLFAELRYAAMGFYGGDVPVYDVERGHVPKMIFAPLSVQVGVDFAL